MGFRTKLDYSSNRQISQREKTDTILSGATIFGLPFSGLTVGPNLETSGEVENYTNVISTFSGNSATTVYNWFDPRMELAAVYLSAITPTTSAITQETGYIYTGDTTIIVDGNTSFLNYTGTNYTVVANYFIDLGGGAYSGTVEHENVTFLTASSLDYSGRTIWIDNPEITRTDRLIISRNPQVGYVWTCVDSEGMGEWVFNSSATTASIWISGTGINSAVLNGGGGIASGVTSVSEGTNTTAGGDYSHSEGFGTVASGIKSHAEGDDTVASGDFSHAEGSNTTASGDYSHSEGFGTVASGIKSHAEGQMTIASGIYSHSEGQSTIASGTDSHAEGGSTMASANASHAEGYNTLASGDFSHSQNLSTTASGDQSHAEGNGTVAWGDDSHAEGTGTKASGDSSHTEGAYTTASGYTSHAEGLFSIAGDGASHAEGSYTFATNTSHAEGDLSQATGFNSHAEGYNTRATNYYSHSQGQNTISSGQSAHAEGVSTIAGGNASHAEGSSTTASGDFSHAEGATTTASGQASHAGGYSSTASGNTSFVHSYNSIVGNNRSVILGGANNTIIYDTFNSDNGIFSSINSSISGNSAYGNVIIGGGYNTIGTQDIGFSFDTAYNSIIGGDNNQIEESVINSGIINGYGNKIIQDARYSLIIGGYNNGIKSNASRSVVLGGTNITATTNDMVYVPNLIINTGGTNSRLGINTSTPEYVIDANGNSARLVLADTYTGADLPFKGFVLSANSVNVPQIAAATNSYLGGFGLSLAMGVLGDNLTTTSNTELLGNSGDTYINSSPKTNNLNIINRSGGSGTNHIRMYAGINSVSAASVPDIQIQGTGTTRGFVGFKNGNPTYNIDAYNNNKSSRLFYYGESPASGGNLTLSATTGLPSFGVAAGASNAPNQITSISFGVRAWDDSIYSVYGYQGDAFIYAGIYTNGLNIISNDGSSLGTGADYIRFYAGQATGAGASNNPDLHIQGSGSSRGYVAINVPNNEDPTQRLDVNGNGRFRSIGSSASAGALHYTADGTLTTNTSDERLKTNINTLNNALDKIKQLRGVTYNWVEEPNGDVRIGFIAQEVNSVIPELTFTNPNSEEQYMGVHYDNVTALLVEAVKELSADVISNTFLETQTILAEDNNIELNYNGSHQSSIDGGITIKYGIDDNTDSYFKINPDGDFVTNVNLIPKGIVIPEYTPTSSSDTYGTIGNFTRDENYLYIKSNNGWTRANLENF